MRCTVVAYGAGVDSTAMIIGLVQRGIRPDAVLFADTGGERDETYSYLYVMQAYLMMQDFPPLTVVRNEVKDFKHWPPYHTLEENCLTNGTLPSVAFGFQRHTCALKWKAAPQHRWVKTFQPAIDTWAAGEKVLRMVGFDASPADTRRRDRAHRGNPNDRFYDFSYPLQDWGWDRERCKQEILGAGLPVPIKSACFFCSAATPAEIRTLPADKLRRIVVMEARAEPRLKTIQGLWGNGCKGTRGSVKKPGRMTDFIVEEGLLPAVEVEDLRKRVPLELVANQRAYAEGEYIPSWPEFFEANCGGEAA